MDGGGEPQCPGIASSRQRFWALSLAQGLLLNFEEDKGKTRGSGGLWLDQEEKFPAGGRQD